MDNSKYLVNVYWQPKRASGQQLIFNGGVTYSVPTYTDGYYVASMPEILLTATASTRDDAYDNLITLSTTAPNSGDPALDTTKTW